MSKGFIDVKVIIPYYLMKYQNKEITIDEFINEIDNLYKSKLK